MSEMNIQLVVKDVTGKGADTILQTKLCFAVPLGGIHGVLGPTGSGKTELCQILAGVTDGFEGSVMTDWYSTTGLAGLTEYEGQKYPVGSIVGSIYAGNDLQMPGAKEVEDLIAASVEEGISDQGFTATLADLQFCAANVIRSVIFAAAQSPCCFR